MEPELSWPDNTNLVFAHKLLEPIKHKHGVGLSWGDLFVLAGTMAIEDMGKILITEIHSASFEILNIPHCLRISTFETGGPVLGFAAGRIDHVDNTQTRGLGPSEEQDRFKHIEVDGAAEEPLGQNTMGLIYVNPAGPMGNPDPQGAADTIRDVFGRMGMGDRENVALIGGGHTFGKCHGAGPEGAGPTPKEQPNNPYPGLHGTGKGVDAVTSGFEGPWTANPTGWDNDYFKNLLNYEWEVHEGPGGSPQWRVKGGKGPKAPSADGKGEQDIMMLTTDIALVTDPEYRKYAEEFANDEKAFAQAFGEVWYKLVNRDLGPVSRLAGPDVAPPQDWQYPLPDAPSEQADMNAVEADLAAMLEDDSSATADWIRLAVNSANTFRFTDYLGGTNGGRIRFSPGKDWKTNEGLDKTLESLQPVKDKFGDGLTWADLIVLAGTVAAKVVGAPSDLGFAPGRSDATDGEGWESLGYMNAEPPTSVDEVYDRNALRGLSSKEFVALAFTRHPSIDALKSLMATPFSDDEDVVDQALKYHPEFKHCVDGYISSGDDSKYASDFAYAWTKIMNVDRFEGPVNNSCLRP